MLAPGRGCGSLVTLGGFSCVSMWHFHLGQPEGLAWAESGWTLPSSDQAVAEGTSQEGAGNPSAAWFPLQRPGNAMASAQEESPQLSCCALWLGLLGPGAWSGCQHQPGQGRPCGQTPVGTYIQVLLMSPMCHAEATSQSLPLTTVWGLQGEPLLEVHPAVTLSCSCGSNLGFAIDTVLRKHHLKQGTTQSDC